MATAMPFGKHRGTDLEEVNSGYLRWIAEQSTQATMELLEAVDAELAWRDKHNAHFYEEA